MPRRPQRAVSQVRAFSLCSSLPRLCKYTACEQLCQPHRQSGSSTQLSCPCSTRRQRYLAAAMLYACRLKSQPVSGFSPWGCPSAGTMPPPGLAEAAPRAQQTPDPCAGAEQQAQRAREHCLPLTCTAHTKTSHDSVTGFRTVEATCRKLITRHKPLFSSILNHWSVGNHLCLCKL